MEPVFTNKAAYDLVSKGEVVSLPVNYDDPFPKLVPHEKFHLSDGRSEIEVEIIDLRSQEYNDNHYHFYVIKKR